MSDSTADAEVVAFQNQARKCEAIAAARPQHYRRMVTFLAAFGYAFPLVVAAILVGAIIILGGLNFGWFEFASLRIPSALMGRGGIVVAILFVVVVRAMWLRFAPTEGVRITGAEAPELFSFIGDIRRQAGGVPIHRVYLVDDMNAAARQKPRLGIFGWHQNELILGLPLMQALSRQELAAVIAHELGHLSGSHGKLGAWIYRTRLFMSRIFEEFEEKRRFGSWIFRRFYGWFGPYFAAYSFALAREQEYEADRLAATVTSGQTIVDALVKLNVASDYMGYVFWNKVWSATSEQSSPPDEVYRKLDEELASVVRWDGAAASLESRQADVTDYVDTHPSLNDRADAVSASIALPEAAGDRAIDLLPDGGVALIRSLSAQWQRDVEDNWNSAYREIQEQRQRLADLDTAASSAQLSAEDSYERARLAEEFMTPKDTLDRYEYARVAAESTDKDYYVAAVYSKGRILAEMGRDDCVPLLEQAMEQNPDYTVAGCQVLEEFFTQAGRDTEAEKYRDRRSAHEALLDEDWAERTAIQRDDTFTMHDYDPRTLEVMLEDIRNLGKKKIKKAWLVRKPTQHRQWESLYFLIVDVGGWKRWTSSDEEFEKLIAEVLSGLSNYDNVSTVVCNSEDGWIVKKADAVVGARIFP